jgi:hypothetical protein
MNIGRNISLRFTTNIEADSRTLNLVATYTPHAIMFNRWPEYYLEDGLIGCFVATIFFTL